MNIVEYPLGKCPKCEECGAFVAVFLSDTTDTTRDAVLRVILTHEKCGFHWSSKSRVPYRELDKMGFHDEHKQDEIEKDPLFFGEQR